MDIGDIRTSGVTTAGLNTNVNETSATLLKLVTLIGKVSVAPGHAVWLGDDTLMVCAWVIPAEA
jgi:hypothetical protein